MRHLLTLLLGSLLWLNATAGQADSMALTPFRPATIPVLVQVDAQGKLAQATPALDLRPRLERLLRANLAEMITAPARDRHGKPVSSQFVLHLRLVTAPAAGGEVLARYTSVGITPVPPGGSWYWVTVDGTRLLLADRDGISRTIPVHPPRRHQDTSAARPGARLPAIDPARAVPIAMPEPPRDLPREP